MREGVHRTDPALEYDVSNNAAPDLRR